MARRRMITVRLGASACVLAALTAPAFGQAPAGDGADDLQSAVPTVRIDPDEFPAECQPRVRAVVEHPTLASHGPMELFTCQPSMYHWLLDHPDQTVKLWRRLGAKCLEIQDLGGGRYGWKDGASDVRWDVILDGPHRRVWYAEGQVKPGPLIPAVPIKALLVLDYAEGKDASGKPAVRHQMQIVVHTDSRITALATRIVGDTAPKAAEKYVGQLQMFYAAMAWYLDQHPDRAEKMFSSLDQPDPPGTKITTPIPARPDGDR